MFLGPTVRELLKDELLPVEIFGGTKRIETFDETKQCIVEEQIYYDPPLYMVDKFHVTGHTEPACMSKPGKVPGIYHFNHPSFKRSNWDQVNTSICEQTFTWMGKYKHMCRSFTRFEYWFFIYIIVYMHNEAVEHRHKHNEQRIETTRKRQWIQQNIG